MTTRSLALGAAALVAAASLTACGSDSDDKPSGPSGTATNPFGTPTATESAAVTEEGYLPVPAGITLTEPGSRLELKEEATAAWRPRQDLVGVVDVSIRRIDVTTIKKSLKNFRLSKEAKASTPYFVRAEVTNVGETDLGARQLPIYLLDSQGRLVAATGVDRAFEPCPGSTLPAIFAPGDEASSCLIFLVPEGRELQSVMFRPPEGVVPLVWTGKAKPLVDKDKKKNKKNKKAKKAEDADRDDAAE